MLLESRKGHDLKLEGSPINDLANVSVGDLIKLHPINFPSIKPKLLVAEGDEVLKNQPIYFDKKNPKVMFTTFASGIVEKIKYGDKRSIHSIDIRINSKRKEVAFEKHTIEDICNMENNKIIETICAGGLWPCIRQRPFSKIASTDLTNKPSSIFISTVGSSPYSPNIDIILNSINLKELQAGIVVLQKISSAKIHITMPQKLNNLLLNDLKDVNLHHYCGPHPSGNISYHISKIDPIKDKDTIKWYICIEDVASIGRCFLSGKIDQRKIIALGGFNNKNKNKHYKVIRGTLISQILNEKIDEKKYRIISGDILAGEKTSMDEAIGFYDNIISVINNISNRKFIGWLSPGLQKYSLSRTFLSKIIKTKMNYNTSMNGSIRAIIPLGYIEKMCNLDIYPTMLIKSILGNDIEMMEKLGIYECDPEDFALCSFVDASKMDIMGIINNGLKLVEEEA